ncbi:MAG: cytochrome c [Candidatus Brocadia sp.]|jgi:cytochrome c
MNLRVIKTAIIVFILTVPISVLAREEIDRKVPNEYLAKKNPFNGSDKLVLERGAYTYSRKCVKCHGENGDGVGSILEGMALPVFNKEYFSKREDGYIFWYVEQGLADTLMPPYGPGSDDRLTEADRWKVIAFMRERFGK